MVEEEWTVPFRGETDSISRGGIDNIGNQGTNTIGRGGTDRIATGGAHNVVAEESIILFEEGLTVLYWQRRN